MKFLTMLCLLLLTLPELAAQSLADRQDRFNACLSGHADLQNRIHAERFQAQEQLVGIRESVQQLIHAHEVRIAGSMLEVNNLRSAVELSMQLRDLDAECVQISDPRVPGSGGRRIYTSASGIDLSRIRRRWWALPIVRSNGMCAMINLGRRMGNRFNLPVYTVAVRLNFRSDIPMRWPFNA